MCTVTYLPLPDNSFILTSNRDEAIVRKTALPPAKYFTNNTIVFFPKDQEAKGTWIATSFNNYTLCLLNGAFEKHQHLPPYKKSRGLVVLDFFMYNNVHNYVNNYDFSGVEPFTLIIVKGQQVLELFEFRWDGNATHLKTLNPKGAYIWSSATLYTKETIAQREQWFSEWLQKNSVYTSDEILFFHHFAGNGKAENNLIMDIEHKKTVSITCIVNEKQSRTIIYEDLINKNLKRSRIY
jgi:uncharacterized protein with NRDE domain